MAPSLLIPIFAGIFTKIASDTLFMVISGTLQSSPAGL